jgi:hypothetical protein
MIYQSCSRLRANLGAPLIRDILVTNDDEDDGFNDDGSYNEFWYFLHVDISFGIIVWVFTIKI